ncbi:MAG TPA: hypothetical protein PKD12_19445 [Nitrospira sp.]|nr:hypothetical protein [Nitrospira sp.]
MNSSTTFRWLILIIPLAWVVIRLLPADPTRSSDLRGVIQQAEEHKSHEEADQFLRNESLFTAHYQSHYATSGQAYQHYRLAYTYGFDLAQNPDNQKMDWKRMEPLARRNWNDGVLGLWNQHQEAVWYGWEQGIKNHGG